MRILKTIITAAFLLGTATCLFSQDLNLKKVGNKFGYENSKGKWL